MPGLSEYKIPSYLEQLAGAKGIQELTLGRLKELRDTCLLYTSNQNNAVAKSESFAESAGIELPSFETGIRNMAAKLRAIPAKVESS